MPWMPIRFFIGCASQASSRRSTTRSPNAAADPPTGGVSIRDSPPRCRAETAETPGNLPVIVVPTGADHNHHALQDEQPIRVGVDRDHDILEVVVADGVLQILEA